MPARMSMSFLRQSNKRLLTFEDGRDFEHSQASDRKHLAESQLHEEHGNARQDKCDEVLREMIESC